MNMWYSKEYVDLGIFTGYEVIDEALFFFV